MNQDGAPSALVGELELPDELSSRKLRTQLLLLAAILLTGVAIVTLLPGLAALRTRLSHAQPGWIVAGAALKVLSSLGYVVVFRVVFGRRMSRRVSYQIGMSEVGANAVVPTGGAGGLALGAWALKRGGMPTPEIARRTVAFFLLTSVANVAGVVLIGAALGLQVLAGEKDLALTLLPATIAALGIAGSLLAGRCAARLHRRLEHTDPAEPARRETLVLRSLAAIADGVNDAVALLRDGDAWLLGGILAYLLFDILILWATFHAFGAAPPLAILALAYLIGELGGLIPVPGGIGGVDAGLVGTLVLYDVPITAATSAVLAYRAIILWIPAILGSAAFLSLRRTVRHTAHEILGDPETTREHPRASTRALHGRDRHAQARS
jgi:uncharacterized protein (TIRG00374 family)